MKKPPKAYYTVRIPWSDTPTVWHPTESSGPFSILLRGAFRHKHAAHAWAKAHLAGNPYTIATVALEPLMSVPEETQVIEISRVVVKPRLRKHCDRSRLVVARKDE